MEGYSGKDRRHIRDDGFEPQSAFEGYVKAKLESMEKRLDCLPCSETFKRLGKVENDIANIKGRAAVLGVIAGFISAFVTKYITGK